MRTPVFSQIRASEVQTHGSVQTNDLCSVRNEDFCCGSYVKAIFTAINFAFLKRKSKELMWASLWQNLTGNAQ